MTLATTQPPAPAADDWRVNNFDLIRLFAAVQVATVHTIVNLNPGGLAVAILDAGLRMFPGVPIFFLISGLLISRSYERSARLRDYYRNRCLRIFPALWVCLIVSIGLVAFEIHAPRAVEPVSSGSWLLWWAAQMTLFQQYAPDFLDGMRLNGALWTIPVEFEFYLLLPVIYGVFRLRTRRGDLSLSGLLAASLAVHWVLVHAAPGSLAAAYRDVLDTVIPYLWMFLTGVLLQRHWNRLRRWIAGRAHWWLLGYLLVCSVCREYFHIGVGSTDMGLWFLLPLAMVVMSCAISVPTLAHTLLANNDVSYGTYIYHMLVIAVMLQLGARGSVAAAATIGISVSLGALSWFLVERPFLRQKHGALRTTPLAAQSAPRPVKSDPLRSSTT